jgi:hypothetical protein
MPELPATEWQRVHLTDSPDVEVAESPPRVETPDVLNDEVMIITTPPRPSGTIRVKLLYSGRSRPIPVEDPWAD